jgi:hypothetical protein
MPSDTHGSTGSASRQAKPRGKAYRLSDAQGLYIEVTPTSSKCWRLKYRVSSRETGLCYGFKRIMRKPLAYPLGNHVVRESTFLILNTYYEDLVSSLNTQSWHSAKKNGTWMMLTITNTTMPFPPRYKTNKPTNCCTRNAIPTATKNASFTPLFLNTNREFIK